MCRRGACQRAAGRARRGGAPPASAGDGAACPGGGRSAVLPGRVPSLATGRWCSAGGGRHRLAALLQALPAYCSAGSRTTEPRVARQRRRPEPAGAVPVGPAAFRRRCRLGMSRPLRTWLVPSTRCPGRRTVGAPALPRCTLAGLPPISDALLRLLGVGAPGLAFQAWPFLAPTALVAAGPPGRAGDHHVHGVEHRPSVVATAPGRRRPAGAGLVLLARPHSTALSSRAAAGLGAGRWRAGLAVVLVSRAPLARTAQSRQGRCAGGPPTAGRCGSYG